MCAGDRSWRERKQRPPAGGGGALAAPSGATLVIAARHQGGDAAVTDEPLAPARRTGPTHPAKGEVRAIRPRVVATIETMRPLLRDLGPTRRNCGLYASAGAPSDLENSRKSSSNNERSRMRHHVIVRSRASVLFMRKNMSMRQFDSRINTQSKIERNSIRTSSLNSNIKGAGGRGLNRGRGQV